MTATREVPASREVVYFLFLFLFFSFDLGSLSGEVVYFYYYLYFSFDLGRPWPAGT